MAAKLEATKHPGIYKRGSKYVARPRVNGKRTAITCRTLNEALKAKRNVESARDRGELDQLSESKARFADYALEWVERYQGNGRRGFTDDTRDEYRRDLERYAIPQLGTLKLSAIRHRDIADFVAWLCDEDKQGRSLADATVRRIVVPVRACMATARREGLRRDNPCDDVPMPVREEADEEAKAKAMTRAELAAFLQLVPPKWSLFFRLLASTGLRWGELVALQWGDLDLDAMKPTLKVKRALAKKQPKGGPARYKAPKSKYGKRTLPLDPALARELRALRTSASPDAEVDAALVFPASNGSPLRQENVRRRVLEPIAGEAGVAWIGFHSFRHTCASMLIDAGRTIVQVQRWLGHHSPAFTLERYAHLMDEGVGDGLDLTAMLAAESESILSPPPHELSRTEPNTALAGMAL